MSNIKFGRNFRVTIEFNDATGKPDPTITPIVITMPFTMQFTVNRKIYASLNTCQVDLYDLGPRIRELIFQEPMITRNKTLTLEAGYDELITIFKGTIRQASSAREGTNIITSIDCVTGQWQVTQSTVYQTLNKGQTLGDVFRFLSGQLPQLSIGAIGKFDDKLLRPVVLNGNVWEIFKRYTGNNVTIDNNQIFVLKPNEVVPGAISVISLDSGILETPRRSGGYINLSTLFEPRVQIMQEVQLVSTVQPIYNGTYKIVGIQHSGVVSAAVNGDFRTMLDLFVGAQTFETVLINSSTGATNGQ